MLKTAAGSGWALTATGWELRNGGRHIRESLRDPFRDFELPSTMRSWYSRNRRKAGKQQAMSLSPTSKSQHGATQGAAGYLRKNSVTSPGANSRHCGLIQPLCPPHHAQPGRSTPSQAESRITVALGLCSVWQWRWTCRECRILGESRTTPHPGLTLGLPGERAGTGFPTERENLIQRAVVLKFFHHSSPLKCWRGYVRKHQLEVWRGRRVRSLWEKSLVEHWPIPKIRKQLHHFGWTKPTQCIWKREVRVMPCWD